MRDVKHDCREEAKEVIDDGLELFEEEALESLRESHGSLFDQIMANLEVSIADKLEEVYKELVTPFTGSATMLIDLAHSYAKTKSPFMREKLLDYLAECTEDPLSEAFDALKGELEEKG